MHAVTCLTLAIVFPLLVVAHVAGNVRVPAPVRRSEWYPRVVGSGVVAALIGLVTVMIGVETDGIADVWSGFAVLAWGTFGIAVATLAVQVITIVVRSVES